VIASREDPAARPRSVAAWSLLVASSIVAAFLFAPKIIFRPSF
jgi:hypothetical protein